MDQRLGVHVFSAMASEQGGVQICDATRKNDESFFTFLFDFEYKHIVQSLGEVLKCAMFLFILSNCWSV